MSYLVHVSLHLNNDAPEVYDAAKQELAKLGLYSSVVGDTKKTSLLPRNTFSGTFEGESAVKIRDDLVSQIKEAFARSKVSASTFISVAPGGWSWFRFTAG